MYELDACLPEDWNLVVQIMSKGAAVDSLIGQFQIDLEDRVLGKILCNNAYSFRFYNHL